TPADSNLDAQFWCARHHYLYGDRAMANSLFKQLASARVASDHRNRVRDVLRGPNNETRFAGVIASMEEGGKGRSRDLRSGICTAWSLCACGANSRIAGRI